MMQTGVQGMIYTRVSQTDQAQVCGRELGLLIRAWHCRIRYIKTIVKYFDCNNNSNQNQAVDPISLI